MASSSDPDRDSNTAAGPGRSTGEGDIDTVARATLALLATRASGATICPSEVARSLAGAAGTDAGGDWRAMMPDVHAAVDRLAADHRIRLTWKGKMLATRAGAYRIGRGVPR